VGFNQFVKNINNYSEFASVVNSSDNKIKGDISEEYWRRWFHFVPHISGYKQIYNANDKSSAKLLHKWPELKVLNIGKPNSALVDLVIEYDNDYDLVSCKWWNDGLDLKEIGSFFTATNQHFPNLRTKYLTTTAPRTSKIATDLAKAGKDVVIIYEQEFIVSDYTWNQIKTWNTNSTPKFEKWSWRNKREQETFIKMARAIKRDTKSIFQGPPGVGKTQLMFKLDKYFWKTQGHGITVNMADGCTVLKQNFDHFNTQYAAYGIHRPSLVICSGAEDADQVDWPVEVVGRDSAKILNWISKNPNGMIFCFYGNSLWLQTAIKAHLTTDPNFKITFASCDEASRTCQQIGSGWSHIVHDHLIPVKYRVFADATPREGHKIGMNNQLLYGSPGDVVFQPEAEKWNSVTGYYVKGLAFSDPGKKIKKWFHERRFANGKKYTVEDYCMAWSILTEKRNDPNDDHTIAFGVTIERLNALKEALNDVRTELVKQNPKTKNIQELNNIEIFVADTHIHTTSDIHNKLEYIYKNKPRSIVLTSRLLYRGWSQVKLDSIFFGDNFKSTSYIIQALGRGLRINKDKPNKLCKIMVPADLDSSGPWNHILGLIELLKGWDYRPVEAIIALSKAGRSKAQRKPTSGGVQIVVNGVNITPRDLKGLSNVLVTNYNSWIEWTEWHQLAKEYIAKISTHSYLFRVSGKGVGFAKEKVFKEIMCNDRFAKLIDSKFKSKTETKQNWLYKVIITDGAFDINKQLTEWTLFKSSLIDVREDNETTIQTLTKQWFDATQQVRRKHALSAQESVGYKFNEFKNELHNTVPADLIKFYPGRSAKSWENATRDLSYGGGTKLSNIDKNYVDTEIQITENLIREEKTKLVEKITSWCINYAKQNFIPSSKIKLYALRQFKKEGLNDRRWAGWIFNQEFPNKFTKDWNNYIKNPFVEPGRPLCIRCGCKGAEKRWNKGYTDWHKHCSTCITEVKKEKETV
jgi:hypothetical protein